jgi:hypothetical protein
MHRNSIQRRKRIKNQFSIQRKGEDGDDIQG